MAGVCVVRSVALRGGDDIGILLDIVLCKAVGCALCRGGLEIIQIAVLLLIVRQALAHVVEYLLCELLALFGGHIGADPVCVESGLVHADKADGRKVVIEISEVILGVGVKSLVEELCYNIALYLQRARGYVHHLIKALEEVGLVGRKIRNARHIDGDNADRTRALAGAEVAAGLLAKLAQVKAQAAAHAADV